MRRDLILRRVRKRLSLYFLHVVVDSPSDEVVRRAVLRGDGAEAGRLAADVSRLQAAAVALADETYRKRERCTRKRALYVVCASEAACQIRLSEYVRRVE